MLLTPGAKTRSRFFLPELGEAWIRLGFALVVALVVISGVLIVRHEQTPAQYLGNRLAALESTEKELANTRRIYSQSITHYRDFIIDGRENALQTYSQALRKDQMALATSLSHIPEHASVKRQFETDSSDYDAVLEQARKFTPKQKAEDGFDYMHEEVMRARGAGQQSLKALSDAIAEDREKLMAEYAERSAILLEWFFVTLGGALASTVGLAWVSHRYRSKLRRENLRKFNEVARSRDDLEHLSGKLLKIQEEERRRLSRELHDGIGQTLTALRMEIHQAHLNAGPATAAGERLARARLLAEEAVHTVKDISLLLRPPLLDDLGLEPAVGWHTDQFTRRTGIPCRFRATGLQELLPDDVKTCVFRVVQEALNNCQKHASPTRVQVLIDQMPEMLLVQVEDDGAGFLLNDENKPVRHSGLGILGMRERATMLGGTLSIRSSLGMGTRLKLALPLATMTLPAAPAEMPPSVPAIGPGV